MKVIMITRGKMERIKTPRILREAGIPYEIVCHTDEDAERLGDWFGVPCHPCHPPEDYRALGFIRDWTLKNLVAPGEWYVGMDDNINEIYAPPADIYFELDHVAEDTGYRQKFMHPIDRTILWNEIQYLRDVCIEHETVYGGFGWMENYFFRRSKWKLQGYVKGKMYVAKNDGQPWIWDQRLGLMIDHAKTYDVIARYGSVVINHWIFPEHGRFEVGGLGTLAERMPHRLATMGVFKDKFAGLVKIYEGESGEMDSPRLCRIGRKSIDQWRKENGYMK